MAVDSEERCQSTNCKPISNEASCSEDTQLNTDYEATGNFILVKSEYIYSDHEELDELNTSVASNDANQSLKIEPDIDSENISSEPVRIGSTNDKTVECVEEEEEKEEDVDDPDEEPETSAVETRKIYLPDFPISNENITENEDPAISREDINHLSGLSDLNLFGQATNVKELWINPIHLCPICGEMIKTAQLLTHSKLHSAEKLECFLCSREFKCRSKLKWHIKVIHMGTKEYVCEFCSKIFPRQGNLTEHMRIHNGDKKHKCTVCPKMFSTNSMLMRHSKIHTGERDWICPVCGKGFAQKGNLMKHKCFLSETKDFVCEFCNKAFKGKYALAVHVKIHGEREELSCEYCPKTCFNITKLKEHLKRMHPGKPAPDGTIPKTRLPAERKFKCEFCDEKAYTSKAALEYHMNGVHPDRFNTTTQHFFQCEVCSKTLTGRQSYDRHVRTHNAERTLQCRLCDKKFATKMSRSTHEQLHSKDNKFFCTKCNKGFPIKMYLKRHEKTHATEQSFQCATCGEMFVSNSRLQIHLETHASTKMYDCHICDSAFSEVSRLRRHLRNKHGIRRRTTINSATSNG
ncbi:hypothetical protein LSTR_LSTR010281 [Laodelphax striatellus]|uniref:C2H2-type domain-containing protein n=2 Tax=Laodelphax striatellus TaxID=195883 RepID=A0A482XS72_LAOST|nr:hypothetical protein LSTR_LSTR010281 [Laodelphax striatellus]